MQVLAVIVSKCSVMPIRQMIAPSPGFAIPMAVVFGCSAPLANCSSTDLASGVYKQKSPTSFIDRVQGSAIPIGVALELHDFSNTDCWRALVLYGLNTATYKIALAKTLLDFALANQSTVTWPELSRAFFEQYRRRLQQNDGMPQGGTPGRRTKMEQFFAEYRLGKLTESQAIEAVGAEAFGDVIPRFHNLGREQGLQGKFYEFDEGRQIILTDAAFDVASEASQLTAEIEARWSLLEGAYSITAGNYKLANDIRDIYLAGGYARKDLTPNIPFLQGYQGNRCFYCGEEISDTVHVDHVLPRQVLHHDEIWNLVVAHEFCNLQKKDRLVGPHFVRKLIARNENIMGSNHPWKKKIIVALGATPAARARRTDAHYKNVTEVLRWNYWGGAPGYSPASDPFYSRLITVLNNKSLR